MKEAVAVLNCDIDQYQQLFLTASKQHKIITYGKAKDADIRIISIEDLGEEQQIRWLINGKEYNCKIEIMGDFQVYNLACSIGLLIAVDIKPDKIFEVIAVVPPVPGRMELVAYKNNSGIYVDYSHKPEALEQALLNLRRTTKNRLLVVFGCGGNRDQAKRRIMGEIASNLADLVFVTDDNPRNEDPATIRKEVLSGCKANACEIDGRELAIFTAMKELQEGDNLLIAGKGHENYQIVGDKVTNFSDKEKILLIASSM